jgi:arsenical pump membrane protein
VSWQLVALVIGVVVTVVPPRRIPAHAAAAAVAVVAVIVQVVPLSAFDDALEALAAPLAFLLVAVPLAVVLDEVGFFSSLAALVDGGRHLRLGLWVLAAAVTVLFNLDAAVVLLTPLFVRLAHRHGDDPVALAFIPALLASLASTVLPVSNLTNLIAAGSLDIGARDFLVEAAPAAVAATVVGWFAYRRTFAPPEHALVVDARPDRRALRIGAPVVVWLLIGFTVGERAGVPAWVVALIALVGLIAVTHRLPWRSTPLGPAVLALSLGTLAVAAAPGLHIDRLLGLHGVGGEVATFGGAVLGANLMNNLPAVVVSLPALQEHPERVWALLLGVNIGPTLWATGALSTLLWQSTMARLGHPVSARRYASIGWRVGIPALLTALAVRSILAA